MPGCLGAFPESHGAHPAREVRGLGHWSLRAVQPRLRELARPHPRLLRIVRCDDGCAMAYVTQAEQSPEFWVLLIAGEEALPRQPPNRLPLHPTVHITSPCRHYGLTCPDSRNVGYA